MQPPSGGLLAKQNISEIYFWDMGKVMQCPRPNFPYMPKGSSGIKRDQAGSSANPSGGTPTSARLRRSEFPAHCWRRPHAGRNSGRLPEFRPAQRAAPGIQSGRAGAFQKYRSKSDIFKTVKIARNGSRRLRKLATRKSLHQGRRRRRRPSHLTRRRRRCHGKGMGTPPPQAADDQSLSDIIISLKGV